MKNSNRKKLGKAKIKRAVRKTPQPREADHQRRFDQLLDDAIFGVKKKGKISE